MVARPSKQEIDEEILDSAAGLIAQRGINQTSVQAVADAVGYSKAGLLHRFPSKEALFAAVIAQCKSQSEALLECVSSLAPGPERDRLAITAVAQNAQRRPGFVSLMLSSVTAYEGSGLDEALKPVADDLLATFAVPDSFADPARVIAVAGALGALAVNSLVLRGLSPEERSPSLTSLVITTSVNALGHRPEDSSAPPPATTTAPKDTP
jgi:AcrR family transcriptional regulator